MPLARRFEVPLLLGEVAELAVGDGGAVQVALLLFDGERF
jgi:hypothetical protein